MSSHTDVPSPSRACRRCGVYYPRTAAFFHRDSLTRDGLKLSCRNCACEAERRRYAASAERIRQRTRERRTERAAYFRTQPQWDAA